MTYQILSEIAASISDLKKNPMGTVAAGEGFTVAILNHNVPAFYCVPADVYESMMERREFRRPGCPGIKIATKSSCAALAIGLCTKSATAS